MQQNAVTVTNLAHIPKRYLGKSGVVELKTQLTVYPRTFKDEFKEVASYEESETTIGIPEVYARSNFPHFSFTNKKSNGLPQQGKYPTPDPNHPKAPKDQAYYLKLVYTYLKENEFLFFKADTGVGKTFISLNAAIKLGRRTIIIVPKSDLAKQWYEDLTKTIGVPEEVVCIYDKDNKKTEGKDFVIATIQSMHKGLEDKEFYASFGTIILDELHNFAAEQFSKTLKMFTAKYRLGLTATEKRGDGAQDVYLVHFGHHVIEAKLKPLPIHVTAIIHNGVKTACYPKKYNGQIVEWVELTKAGQIARMVADKSRFDMIIALITKQYELGHNILVTGDHVMYLQHIVKALRDKGIENSHYFVGQYYDLDPLPSLQNLGKLAKYSKNKKTMDPKEKKQILSHGRVICATYGVFKEGVSETRLNVGIDVTPISTAEQVNGRVRRMHKGKDCAFWFTIVDGQNDFALRSYKARLQEYMRLAETVKEYDCDTGTINKLK